MPYLWGALALVAINAWTILVWRHDKQCAVAGVRRRSERELLTLALIGGTPGAFFARRRFRHKTRKQPFSTWLWAIAFVQMGVAIGLLWPR
jgi:uncharacterized membrane protein YsdA (DUF1294 family)